MADSAPGLWRDMANQLTTELIYKISIPEMVKITGVQPRSQYTFLAAAIIVVGSVQRLLKVTDERGT
jgi:hypothetical protein